MQFLVAALIGGLLSALTSIIGRVLLSLGIGYVTFTGVSTLGDWVMNQMQTVMMGLPSDVAAFLAYMYIDKSITMIFSAMVAALAFKLGGSDTVTQMITQRPVKP